MNFIISQTIPAAIIDVAAIKVISAPCQCNIFINAPTTRIRNPKKTRISGHFR